MSQLEHIEAIEKRLWCADGNLCGTLPKGEYQELDYDPRQTPVGTKKRLPDEKNHAA
jgi:hypothetical protein